MLLVLKFGEWMEKLKLAIVYRCAALRSPARRTYKPKTHAFYLRKLGANILTYDRIKLKL